MNDIFKDVTIKLLGISISSVYLKLSIIINNFNLYILILIQKECMESDSNINYEDSSIEKNLTPIIIDQIIRTPSNDETSSESKALQFKVVKRSEENNHLKRYFKVKY